MNVPSSLATCKNKVRVDHVVVQCSQDIKEVRLGPSLSHPGIGFRFEGRVRVVYPACACGNHLAPSVGRA